MRMVFVVPCDPEVSRGVASPRAACLQLLQHCNHGVQTVQDRALLKPCSHKLQPLGLCWAGEKRTHGCVLPSSSLPCAITADTATGVADTCGDEDVTTSGCRSLLLPLGAAGLLLGVCCFLLLLLLLPAHPQMQKQSRSLFLPW